MADKRETKQKKIIEETISRFNKFFTVDDLYSKLEKDNTGIGIATVYRFLKELQKERKTHSYICERKRIYSKSEMNHSHFVCEICGEKKHIEIRKADFLKNFSESDVCHIQIEINGICKKCKNNLR